MGYSSRIEKIDTRSFGNRVIAIRYRISSQQKSPWLIAMGEEVLPTNVYARGRMLSLFYNQQKGA